MISKEEKLAADNSDWTEEVGKKAPNILTFIRIIAIPFFMYLLTVPTPESHLWAAGIFVFASLTDWLDGYIARIYKAETIIGTLLDPIADKVLVMAALVMLTAVQTEPRVPAWIVVALLAREFLVSGLRSLAAVQGNVVAASRFAKHKTAWTMLAIFFLLVAKPYTVFGINIDFFQVGMWCLWIALFLSVTTGIHYAVKLKNVFLE